MIKTMQPQRMPKDVQALIVAYLTPGEAGRALMGGFAEDEVVELGAWLALSFLNPVLYAEDEESWRSLWRLWSVLGNGGTYLLFGIGSASRPTGEALLGYAKAEPMSKRRLADAARRMAKLGFWDLGVELLEFVVDETPGATIVRFVRRYFFKRESPWRASVLIDASAFLVDRLYACTYVQESDSDSIAVARALSYAEQAETLLRANRDVRVPKKKKTTRGPVIENEPGDGGIPRYLADAAIAVGRAASLAAQHVALGVLRVPAVRDAGISFVADPRILFQQSGDAFERAQIRAQVLHDDTRLARATAGEAERFYCMASAMTKPLIALNSARLRSLCDESISQSLNALKILSRVDDAMDSDVAVPMFKDLGKVYGFRFAVFGALDDQVNARTYLLRALDILRRSRGESHMSTLNVKLLLGWPDHAPTGAVLTTDA